jgi:hypothetical protein
LRRDNMASLVGTWRINGNGYDGVLSVQQVDNRGQLINATVYGNAIIGFWDDVSQKLSFIRMTDPRNPKTSQVYTGYMMEHQGNGGLALAGSFEAFQGTGASAQRVVYGWYAFPA